MIDRTNEVALKSLKDKYGDQIANYEYKSWKEAYLDKPPPRAFCAGFTRYRQCFKVTHVVLKDGRKIPLEDNIGCSIVAIFFAVVIILLVLFKSCSY